ncbi:hypothetical protein [Novosphingobium aquimarinum]|uniref:hypothetical protein n=1 Tax=Novosphingobium aquimarinum TaxID=2682494 RepID=UPI0012EC3857|nr:hypothetical protein [Novosphingobium aquimarinum]
MKRAALVSGLALLAATSCLAAGARIAAGDGKEPLGSEALSDISIEDDFATTCIVPCAHAAWADTQQIQGKIITLAKAEGRNGVLMAKAGARRTVVPKAGLIARFARMPSGSRLTASFDLFVPRGYPVNSIHLMDLECASCGVSGNPGVRLYLRHGRLRVDRSKIGIEHAWANDDAPALQQGRWHHINVNAVMSADDAAGSVDVRLDGARVLSGTGRTLLPGRMAGFDRLQFGITATSNDTEVRALFDRFEARVSPR